MPQDAQKAINLIDNLLRLSEYEALQGSYLNAIMMLVQTGKDVRKKLKQGILTGDQAKQILTKIGSMKYQYFNQAKGASPRKFNYDLPGQAVSTSSSNSSCSSRASEANEENN